MHEFFHTVFPNENFVDVGLFQFGRENCEPGHSFGPASRNHFLFHYVLSGHGSLITYEGGREAATFEVRAGQGFMLHPGQVSLYVADAREPWDYVWVEFDGLRVKSVVEGAGLTPASPVYRAHDVPLRDAMRGELLYMTEHRDAPALHLIGHLYLFLDALSRSSATIRQKQGGQLRDFYVQEAVEFIEHHFQDDISVEDIAAGCGLNRSYFGKIFRDAMGKTPQDFLISYRMGKAAELLAVSAQTVGEISAAVGYASPLHFSRAFKNVYGVSPRAWRTAQRTGTPP